MPQIFSAILVFVRNLQSPLQSNPLSITQDQQQQEDEDDNTSPFYQMIAFQLRRVANLCLLKTWYRVTDGERALKVIGGRGWVKSSNFKLAKIKLNKELLPVSKVISYFFLSGRYLLG